MSLTPEQMQATNQFLSLPFVRNSEREQFNKCPAAWNWAWNEGLTLAMPRQDARWFGTLIHLALAEWYTPPKGATGPKRGFTRGADPREVFKREAKGVFTTISAGPYFDEVAEQEYHDAVGLGDIMLNAYLVEYGLDEAWEVLLPETRFRINIPFNSRQSRLPYSYWLSLGYPKGASGHIAKGVGTFDMPIRDHTDGHVKLVDHKTTNRRENTAWLIKDNQNGFYIAVSTAVLRHMGFIKENEAVVGAIWNYLRKGKPDARPKDELGRCLNNDGSVSKKQPSPLFWREDLRRNKHNRLRQMQRAADDVELMQAVRNGVLPVTKHPGEHCGWCDFKELCDVDEDGGDTENFKKAVFKVQDVYADHRQGAKNSKVSE